MAHFFNILWPNFAESDHFRIELAYLVSNDPDLQKLPTTFYEQMANIIITTWRIQLEDLYPNGDWAIEVLDDPEMTVQAEVRHRA